MKKKVITRKLIASRINDLLKEKINRRTFGEEMLNYLTYSDEDDIQKYELEKSHEKLIKEVLTVFMDMHDLDKGDVGYKPYSPSIEELKRFRDILNK